MEHYNQKYKNEFNLMNSRQKEAVLHGEGRALCIAGPGSGKTRVIALRAVRLGSEYYGRGEKGTVLTLAFNRHACIEMRERGEKYCREFWGDEGDKYKNRINFYTIHAYCLRLVKMYAGLRGLTAPSIISTELTADFVREHRMKNNGGRPPSNDTVKRYMSFVTGEAVIRNAADVNEAQQRIIEAIKKDYNEFKRAENLVDFTDMLVLAKKYMEEDEKFAEAVKRQYAFLQVDEAQDLSEVQSEIIKLLSPDNTMLVADDDQSIYGFRGARPEILLAFGEDSGVRRFILNKNYRSNSEIVELATGFININDKRFPKKLVSGRGKGGSVKLKYFDKIEEEAGFAARFLISGRKHGEKACVLYRNNASALLIMAELYFACGKSADKYLPSVSGEYIKLGNSVTLKKIAGEISEREKNGKMMPSEILEEMRGEGKLQLLLAGGELGGRRPFYGAVMECVLKLLAGKSRRGEEIVRYAKEIDAFAEAKEKNNETFPGVGFVDGPAEICRDESQEKFGYTNTGSGPSQDREGGIYFSTVHSAKGLEYDSVMIADCVAGEFPCGNISKEEILREERRLMYVAMTRAKNELIIGVPGRAGEIELNKSIFAEEIELIS